MLDGEKSIYEIFQEEKNQIIRITYDTNKKESYKKIKFKDINPLELPEEDFCLEEEDKEEYLDFFGQSTNDEKCFSQSYFNKNMIYETNIFTAKKDRTKTIKSPYTIFSNNENVRYVTDDIYNKLQYNSFCYNFQLDMMNGQELCCV